MNESGIELVIDNSAFYFKLGEILKARRISKSKLCRETNTDYKVVNRLIRGEIIRIDVYVLTRICEYLDCDMSDIIKFKCNIYKKPSKK